MWTSGRHRVWLRDYIYDTIAMKYLAGRGNIMADKPDTDLNTFIENVNKKDTKRNGKKIRFGFTKRKRK